MIKTYADIIDLWPSVAELAFDVDVKPDRVRKWRERDSIPGDFWWRVAEGAKVRGIPGVTVELLSRMVKKEGANGNPG